MDDCLRATIVIGSEHITKLEEHARYNYPIESCALILGTRKGNQFQVRRIQNMKNYGNSRDFFEMDLDELMIAYTKSSREGVDIIGVFHSHLEGSVPSLTDQIYMEINPIVWVIYSCKHKKFQAYLSNEEMDEVAIIVKD